MNRRERERDRHRREMIVAARRVFATRGYAETTMEEVAAAAEFGKGTIYNYFTAKEELFAEVIDQTLRELRSIVASSMLDDGRPFAERVETLVRTMLEYAIETPESLYLVARELRVPTLDTRAGDAVAAMIEPLSEQIAGEQEQGRLTPEIEARVLGQILLSMTLGRFLNMVRVGAGQVEGMSTAGWCNAIMAARTNEDGLRGELESAVAAILRVFLHGALLPAPAASERRATTTRSKR